MNKEHFVDKSFHSGSCLCLYHRLKKKAIYEEIFLKQNECLYLCGEYSNKEMYLTVGCYLFSVEHTCRFLF